MINKENITTVILAGGKAERMNGKDKGLLKINNTFVIEQLYKISAKFTSKVYINANRNINKYKKMGYTVLVDAFDGFQGPLAGIYTALLNTKTDYLLILPCDGPLINDAYFKKMLSGDDDFEIKCAHDGKRIQPVHALIKNNITESLKKFLLTGQRKIDKWYNDRNLKLIDFSDNKNLFININSPKDLIEYESLLKK
jgi:molybdopterin-guanine dinucleotide biosynthesis protein A